MSKTTKRVVGLGVLLLCLAVGVVPLYRRWSSAGSHEASPAPAAVALVPPAAPPSTLAAEASAPVATARPEPSATNGAEHRMTDRERGTRRVAAARRSSAGVAAGGASEPARTTPAPGEPLPVAPEIALGAEAPAPAQTKGGNVAIRLRPKLGERFQAFQLIKVSVSIDGRVVGVVEDKESQERKELEVWRGTVETGEHSLKVLANYRGNGHSVFSYFERYRYTARSSTQFGVKEGGKSEITIDLVDKGGANTAFEERVAIAFIK